MTHNDDDILVAGLNSVREQLLDHITQPKSEREPPDKWAKTFSALVKAEADAKARLSEREAEEAAKQHTRYEDMPPPTPEDEARFDAEFQKILSALFDENAVESGVEGEV